MVSQTLLSASENGAALGRTLWMSWVSAWGEGRVLIGINPQGSTETKGSNEEKMPKIMKEDCREIECSLFIEEMECRAVPCESLKARTRSIGTVATQHE